MAIKVIPSDEGSGADLSRWDALRIALAWELNVAAADVLAPTEASPYETPVVAFNVLKDSEFSGTVYVVGIKHREVDFVILRFWDADSDEASYNEYFVYVSRQVDSSWQMHKNAIEVSPELSDEVPFVDLSLAEQLTLFFK